MRRPGGRRTQILSWLSPVAVVAALALSQVGVAQADHDDSVVSSTPVDGTPHVLGDPTNDERVLDLVEYGDLVIVVGRFTEVQAVNGEPISRLYAYAFDVDTGAIDEDFAPRFDGQVNSVAVAPDGHLLFGGEFEYIGEHRSRHLVKLNRHGEVVEDFRVIPNRAVVQIEIVGDTAYLAGSFFRVNGVDRELIASVDAISGELQGLSLDFEEPRETIGINPELVVRAMDISPDASTMVIGGGFHRIDDQRRSYLAVIDLVGEQLSPWYTSSYEIECRGRRQQTPIWDVDIDPTGEFFVVVTTGFTGLEPGGLCDAAVRFELDATADDVAPSWVNYSNGDSLTEVEITGSAVYIGGHMRWVNGLDVPGDRTENTDRAGLAALDARNGVPMSWRADRQPRGGGVWELLATDRGLWVGSDTDYVSGEYRGKLALLPLDGGTQIEVPWSPTLPATLTSIDPGPGDDDDPLTGLVSRPFDGLVVPAFSEPVADSAAQVSAVGAATRIGDTMIFTRTDTHVIAARDFDGRALGPVRSLDPVGLGPAEWPLQQITGMFFDHRLGRLYYTLDGDDSLYHRGFSPDSEIFAPVAGVTTTSGFPWGSVRGMDVVDGRLYVGGLDGVLRSYLIDEENRPDPASERNHGPLVARDSVGYGAFFVGPPGNESGVVRHRTVQDRPLLRFVVDLAADGATVSRPVHLEAGVDTIISLQVDDPAANARIFVTDENGDALMADRSDATRRVFRVRADTTGLHEVNVRLETGSSRVRIAVEPTTTDLPDPAEHRPDLIGRWQMSGDARPDRWPSHNIDVSAGTDVTVDLAWPSEAGEMALVVRDPNGDIVIEGRTGDGRITETFTPSTSGRHRIIIGRPDDTTGYTVSAHRDNSSPIMVAQTFVVSPADVTFDQNLAAVDPDGDHLRFTADGLPPGVDLTDDGHLRGRADGVGRWDIDVTATDSFGGSATTTVRWVSTWPDHRHEDGLVSIGNDRSGDWMHVEFAEPFAFTPVVIVGPPSFRDTNPAVVRVRDVTTTGFEMTLQNWAGPRQFHEEESVAWFAALPGEHALGDLRMVVGRFDTDHQHDHAPFAAVFDETPVVLSTVQTRVDSRQVTTRIDNLSNDGFEVRLSSASDTERYRSEETVGFVAIERGTTVLDGRTINVDSAEIDDNPTVVPAAGLGPAPSLFAMILDDEGEDNATVRYRAADGGPVRVWIEEDTTADAETAHKSEEVGWLTFLG